MNISRHIFKSICKRISIRTIKGFVKDLSIFLQVWYGTRATYTNIFSTVVDIGSGMHTSLGLL